MKTGQKITKALAFAYIVALCTYSSFLIGTLAHELGHQKNAIAVSSLSVNYDASGQTEGVFWKHSHEFIYFQGFVVESAMILLTLLSLAVIIS